MCSCSTSCNCNSVRLPIGPQGIQGPIGTQGDDGNQGLFGGYSSAWLYDSTLTTTPGIGDLTLDSATPGLVTAIYLNQYNSNVVAVDDFILSFDNSSSFGKIRLFDELDSTIFHYFELTGVSYSSGIYTLTVIYIAGAGSLTNNNSLVISFTPNGVVSGAGWLLGGNVNAMEEYIGTNIGYDFPIRTSAIERGRFHAGGVYFNLLAEEYQNQGFRAIKYSNDRTWFLSSAGPIASGSFGSDCLGIGYNSLFAGPSGVNNIGIGSYSLSSVDVGTSNTAIGVSALGTLTSGIRNIGIGYISGLGITAGSENIAIGDNTLMALALGDWNTTIGVFSLQALSNGNGNVAVGWDTCISLTTGDNNTIIGKSIANAMTSGSHNIILGANNIDDMVTGSNNTIIGSNIIGYGDIDEHILIADGNGLVRFECTDTGDISLLGNTLEMGTLTVSAAVATASTNKILVTINGVSYYLLATTIP